VTSVLLDRWSVTSGEETDPAGTRFSSLHR
jgi:hypothetical protein